MTHRGWSNLIWKEIQEDEQAPEKTDHSWVDHPPCTQVSAPASVREEAKTHPGGSMISIVTFQFNDFVPSLSTIFSPAFVKFSLKLLAVLTFRPPGCNYPNRALLTSKRHNTSLSLSSENNACGYRENEKSLQRETLTLCQLPWSFKDYWLGRGIVLNWEHWTGFIAIRFHIQINSWVHCQLQKCPD